VWTIADMYINVNHFKMNSIKKKEFLKIAVLLTTYFVLKKLRFIADIGIKSNDKAVVRLNMADIIGFPKTDLTPGERKQLEKFMETELAYIEGTACESIDEITDEIMVFFGYILNPM